MSILNQIQGGRWDQGLRRIFSMKQGAIAPTLAGELLAAIILENDRPENFAMVGTRLCQGGTASNGVAAQRSMVQLMNPVGSGVVGVVTAVVQLLNGAGKHGLSHTITALTTATFGFLTDTRLFNFTGTTIRSTLQVRSLTAAALVTSTQIARCSGIVNDQVPYIISPIILKPGTGILTAPDAVNTSNTTHFTWYERPLQPSEEIVSEP